MVRKKVLGFHQIRIIDEATGKKSALRTRFDEPRRGRLVDISVSGRRDADECWASIQHDQDAVNALTTLERHGCDRTEILAIVNEYCMHPRPEFRDALRKEMTARKKLIRTIGRVRNHILGTEAKINKLNRQIEADLDLVTSEHAPDFRTYLAVLFLAENWELPSEILPNIKKWLFLYLYHLIRLFSGRPHYRELANLLMARMKKANPNEIVSEENLQAIVKRAKRSERGLYDLCARDARLRLRSLRPRSNKSHAR